MAPEAVEASSMRLRLPSEIVEISLLVSRNKADFINAQTLSTEALLRLLLRCDALRRPARFAEMLRICVLGLGEFPAENYLVRAAEALRTVDGGKIAAGKPANIAKAIQEAQLAVLQALS
jgi:tRNA nucleotidyltransferase (CCA-adding enzyme)